MEPSVIDGSEFGQAREVWKSRFSNSGLRKKQSAAISFFPRVRVNFGKDPMAMVCLIVPV